MSKSKAKGTAAETAWVRWLRQNGFPHAERRALNGTQDRGDVAGVPGTVMEIKNCARTELAAWVDEAELEKVNDGAQDAAVVHKRRGTTDPARWFVTMAGADYATLLRQAGKGLPLEDAA